LMIGELINRLVLSRNNKKDKKSLMNIINEFESMQVDTVLLACTDLQLLAPKHPRMKIYDSMQILVDSTVSKMLE